MVAEEQKRELLEFAVQMARRVGAIHLEWFRRSDLEIGTKSNEFDVVTRADRESEACIARMVAERYPSHALLGEEGGQRGDAASDWLWVVDPLDGTTNYSQGLPVFAVSIGLRFRGEPVVGVVYAPWLDELFTAVRGGGAFRSCRGGVPQQIRVGSKQRLGEAVVATGFPYDKDRDPDNNTDNVVRILPPCAGAAPLRGCGLRPVQRGCRDDGRLLGARAARVGRLCRRVDRAGGRRCRAGAAAGPRGLDRGRECGDRGRHPGVCAITPLMCRSDAGDPKGEEDPGLRWPRISAAGEDVRVAAEHEKSATRVGLRIFCVRSRVSVCLSGVLPEERIFSSSPVPGGAPRRIQRISS